MLTPEAIAKLSAPIGEVYRQCVDELLLNAASHLESGDALASLDWQVQKLAEFGQLRRENIEIIKSLTGNVPALLDGTFGSAIMTALESVEPELAAAAALGVLQGKELPPLAADSIRNILTNYSAQAANQLNLVNTVMLNSSLAQYRKVIANTVAYEQQLDHAQRILNAKTAEVATGMTSRTQALRKAVQQMNAAGLTGFKDAGGHDWSPEAYVNMDIRTTVHNVAVQSVMQRSADYGCNLILVSSHAGARPLCYPYQGKIYSTDGKSGAVEDLHGNTIEYEPLEATSYGLPAGLFGINCGHNPSPFIPGMSVIRDEPQDNAANDKQYGDSQKQRRLEREVRYAKREAAMLNKIGDKEGFDKAAARVHLKQANLNRFVGSTGRTARVDRTQVVGYDRSVAGKVGAANRRAEANRSVYSKGVSSNSSRKQASYTSLAAREKTQVAKSILDVEDKIRNGKVEQAYVFSKNGNLEFHKTGDASSVNFTQAQITLMKDKILTHNHPSSATFSPHDINMLRRGALQELRVCHSEGTYVLRSPENWPDSIASLERIAAEYYKIDGELAPKYLEISTASGRHILSYDLQMQDETIALFCKRFGLKYIMEV